MISLKNALFKMSMQIEKNALRIDIKNIKKLRLNLHLGIRFRILNSINSIKLKVY